MTKQQTAKDFEAEWISVNHHKGYASGTIYKENTRKYHSLLTIKDRFSENRYTLVNTIDEVVTLQNGEQHRLKPIAFTNSRLEKSAMMTLGYFPEPIPQFIYHMEQGQIVKNIMMLPFDQTTLIHYKNNTQQAVTLNLKPLISCRNEHHVCQQNNDFNTQLTTISNGIFIKPQSHIPGVYLQAASNAKIEQRQAEYWYNEILYQEEKDRGLSYQEDLYCPREWVITLEPGQQAWLSLSTSPQKHISLSWHDHKNKKHEIKQKNTFNKSQLHKSLQQAAYTFICMDKLDKNYSLLAGYPWFQDWGRDTMISLPGIYHSKEYQPHYLKTLKHYSDHIRRGLIPNMIQNHQKEPTYNSADASLWFIWACQQYVKQFNDLHGLYDAVGDSLFSIIEHYQQGTDFGIAMHDNGLIYLEHDDKNLTWMDAMINDVPQTPRNGYVVEINALWYNALCFAEKISKKVRPNATRSIKKIRKKIPKSFKKTFWCRKQKHCHDSVQHHQVDNSLRPNQIFALALEHSPLKKRVKRKVLQAVEEHLLTPFGLRTLSPLDNNYHAEYHGCPQTRDKAYHNGTIWPWLLGFYADALHQTKTNKKTLKEKLHPCLASLEASLPEYGYGSIAEIYDAEEPHLPRGCHSQLWSVASTLRILKSLEEKGVEYA